ncbi:Folate-dependent phosphoribosylglycinamide formyltransferase PurN (PurN) (PDB:1C2T) (PUBMED:25013077) [Commensalibacter communis]|uniref:Phosphoribosylglycinamide formyltransferase n=1 Tax=Commensalibacter communis TaxID=2972786 RepID=A0A9W4X6V6_9PROT|nr:phosphoribosylglycinamide formyltransferase [Commensalibacter communis]CAI3923249.1 Folate-dependent phosphoribosylglycinamide formyltransferase PurN (PurN) (PDB:1C2T) (PUBMED:25013077) [Commensalibacter communis]CAI3923777.1 Folate-dependent phosphoribosylglycinamide formyltransferase PurN (PurN) (PDB:1C2T) (PUBMED:25013077) [Commensalibacter communis]CAI3935944.1 Folate-dependent phosphoribosylglycinamide formyltransferase PurN (PurN) (PDB:1C2T) (PUBMED:25013077) [Commensalibacter communis]
MSFKERIAILISGRGSNMDALIAACAKPSFPASVELVISNNHDAAGLDTARDAGIPTQVIDHHQFGKDRQAHERQIDAALQAHNISTICLAGYMRILTPFLINNWEGKILNIHPSILPLFPGLDTHAKAIKAGMKVHGCTVHIVTEDMDQGPILGQAVVPVLPNDTEHSLAKRLLKQEHLLYPQVLKNFLRKEEPDINVDALING